ncbi:MAG: hypothetical protein QXZ25_04515 [Candidatus Bathyarchaeia archaeon]|nr:hypothetical protein [Candidatus Jingweiarchaeum tengchongense]
MKSVLKRIVKKAINRVTNYIARELELENKSNSEVKVQQVALYNYYRQVLEQGKRIGLSDVGFRVFSQFEEDGILLYIFAAIGMGNRTFIDIGSGDGINSNCANLAINWGWYGLFIDGNLSNIERGKAYYAKHPDTALYPPKFVHAFVTRENINELIEHAGFKGG